MGVNTILCNVGGANTGVPSCAFTMKNIVKVFLVPNSFELSATDLLSQEAALAKLVAAAAADLPSQRIYPTPSIVGLTNNSEDVVTQTLGYGVPVVVRDGKQILQFQYLRGGNCVSNAMRRFNNSWDGRVLFLDASGVIVGTKVGETIKGIPLDQFYARPFTINDGANVSAYSFQITFDPVYINEAIGFYQLPLADALAIDGLQNIVLKLVSRAAAVLTVQAFSGCNQTNLFDSYETELADITNWLPKALNGNAIDVASVAAVPNSSGFAITLDDEDPDYSATAAMTLELAAPSVLADNDIVGYEGIRLSIAAV